MRLRIITLTNKEHSGLPTLTVSCGKRRCLIKSKKKKTKHNKNKIHKIKKRIKNLIKMIMEAKTVMISWHYNTMKIRNNSKSERVEK